MPGVPAASGTSAAENGCKDRLERSLVCNTGDIQMTSNAKASPNKDKADKQGLPKSSDVQSVGLEQKKLCARFMTFASIWLIQMSFHTLVIQSGAES